MATGAAQALWRRPKRVALRFALVLFPLLCAPSPIDFVPMCHGLANAYLTAKTAAGTWIAVHILHVHLPATGSNLGGGTLESSSEPLRTSLR